MKIDRRFFLSFVAGGAVGSILSPLPWKLMDDVSIWSQVWPWVPIPKYGKSTYLKSTCSLCNVNCGISVRKVGDRVVKIEGLENHFINNGSICGLGLSGPQFLYGPFRIASPMLCVDKRGSGKWKKISWERAISIIIEKLSELSVDGRNSRVGCISGLPRGSVAELIKRFFEVYGTSNFAESYSTLDMFSSALKYFCNSKSDLSVCFDLEASDYILSFGSGLFDGWLSPNEMVEIQKNLKNKKSTLVQVESIFSNTAAKSNSWVPIKPGTESDLAFGIVAHMIHEGYYDRNFVVSSFPKFDTWKSTFLKKYNLESVSKITEIDISTIIDVSKSFYESENSVAVCGSGNGNTPSSYLEYVSIFMLNFFKGNFNKSGGLKVNKLKNYLNWPVIENTGELAKNCNFTVDSFFIDLSMKKFELDLMFIVEGNPLYAFPDTSISKKVINSVPFIVNFSSFMDETAIQSDLLLPSSIYLEKFEEINISKNCDKLALGLSQPVVSEVLNTRNLGDVFINIAQNMGGKFSDSFPWKNYEDCLKFSLGDKWDLLVKKGVWIGSELDKFEVDNFDFSKIDYESSSSEKNCDKFPLTLVPIASMAIPNSYMFTSPFLIKNIPDTILKDKIGFVDVNPETAANFGIKNGGYADLTTPRGKARVRVNFCHGVKHGVIAMVRGLGHRAYDEYISEKGVNVNDFTCFFRDSVFGYNVACGVKANLTRA